MMKTTLCLVVWLCGCLLAVAAGQEESREIRLTEGLMIQSPGRGGRNPVHTDALEAHLVAGTWQPPEAGASLVLPDGTKKTWKAARAGKGGRFQPGAFKGGYAWFSVDLEEEDTWILEASGHGLVYVNGEIRAGDPYATRWLRVPVELGEGKNQFLFRLGRRPFSARLVRPKSPAFFNTRDTTLPDVLAGEEIQTHGAVVVVNASSRILSRAFLAVSLQGGEPLRVPLPLLPPLTARKVAFPLQGPAPTDGKTLTVRLELYPTLRRRSRKFADIATLTLNVRRPDEPHCRTFLSGIDGSVQYYAVHPAGPSAKRPGLVLSCHGAGVRALNQARSYSRKSWCHLVAPTNRRPFGFDWEDWGRLDALEVLDLAQKDLGTDPRRTYLTGHSMGGHGAWHLAVTFPDRFAAVGPSAGWISFWSYSTARNFKGTSGIEPLLMRAASPSRTLDLAPNLSAMGVYILHGEKDDNVPVTEARRMRKHLKAFHKDLGYHEEPGMGHWWDNDKKIPGTACVDWPPMMAFFQKHRVLEGAEARSIDFLTASPGVSARCQWVEVLAQQKCLEVSRVQIRFDGAKRTVSGTTENVARLRLDLESWTPAEPGGTWSICLDKSEIRDLPWPPGPEKSVWLARSAGGKWTVGPAPSAARKGPHRYGPFREVFRNRMVFVYATDGDEVENAWALARARYDAETFGYRGNGSVDVIPDAVFDADAHPDRNVILYGNADNHMTWEALLGKSPVQVTRTGVRIGDREEKGEDLACLFLRPRPGSDRALVGAVAGTGERGLRLTDRLPYFVSGIAYPDVIVFGPEMLSKGTAGVRAAGFFGPDWSVKRGEIVWRKESD